MADDDRRIFEYFIVAGLTSDAENLTPGAQECGSKNAAPQAPITDICVIFPGLGEQIPDGFECIETTPSGYPADLNHGSIRTQSIYMCYRRGFHKPPLVDIGVLYEGKGERVMVDSQILKTTPFGRLANINNAAQGIYLTYRRAPENSSPNLLAVTDICIILGNKGETAPHTFCRITKNLNKGMVGSDVFICYKKSQANAKRLAYKPAILDRFPQSDDVEFPLPPNVPIFCLPMGAVIECWPAKCQAPSKLFSTFVLTDDRGRKCYGAAVNFYETLTGELTPDQLERLELGPDTQSQGGTVGDNSSTNDPTEQMSFHVNKALCVVSRYPFFAAFKRFLFYLHRMSVTGTYSVPIERYISHLMYEVPFPTPRRPRVLMQLGNETISFDSHDDSQLPLSGAAFIDTLKCLGADNCMYLVLLALLEHKILIHSLRPYLLTSVAEAVCSLIFPFHWQCPYIPQCPLDLAGVLHCPLPFIAGVDSRYFELYEDPPRDVTCIDLDTSTISASDVRKTLKLSVLPRKPAKLLKQTLEMLYHRAHQEDFNVTAMRRSTDFMPIDVDYQIQKRRRTLEIEVQEAFLRFTASLMKGYTAFLKPIKSAPKVGATDTGALFDLDGFLRTRDKSGLDFYKRFSDTQCFIRFIEERSFASDKNAHNAFFDDCLAKVDPSGDRPEPHLLEYESSLNSDHTVFIAPPEPPLTEDGQERRFEYQRFPLTLDLQLFALEKLEAPASKIQQRKHKFSYSVGGGGATTAAVLRTKQEAKTGLRLAQQLAASPLRWAKCLLTYGYSLWFMHLPAYLELSASKQKTLRVAFLVLDRMEQSRLPNLDEICYRTLMQLCGQCGKPLMAVKVHMAMQRNGLNLNAVTYGIYHRAVLEAKWPSMNALAAVKAWTKLRHAVRAIALLKRAARKAARRPLAKRTPSTISHDSINTSQTSQTSLNQPKPPSGDVVSIANSGGPVDEERAKQKQTIDDAVPDGGYHSQTTVDSFVNERTIIATSTEERPCIINSDILEAFEDYRSRGNIVNPKKVSRSGVNLRAYDSPAGLLITANSTDAKSFNADRSAVRRSLDFTSKPLRLATTGAPGAVGKNSEKTPSTPVGSDAHLLSDGMDDGKYRTTNLAVDHVIEESSEETHLLPKENVKSTDSALSPSKRGALLRSSGDIDADPLGALLNDPLGVASKESKESTPTHTTAALSKVTEDQTKVFMSPSRAKFLEEHRQLPFAADELEKKQEDKQEEESYSPFGKAGMRGWLNKGFKGLTNSPGMRLIRSQTFGDSSPKDGVVGEDGLPISPSLSSLVSEVKSRMEDALTNQQPTISKLRIGVSSLMKEVRSLNRSMNQYSPMRGSMGSLSNLDGTDHEDDVSLKDDDQLSASAGGGSATWDLSADDPAFLLSSGETGAIVNLDATVVVNPSESVEAMMCSCTRCPHCQALVYDEEIMTGWSADESNLNSVCPFCAHPFVPLLTIRLVRHPGPFASDIVEESWYAKKSGVSPRRSRFDRHASSPDGAYNANNPNGLIGDTATKTWNRPRMFPSRSPDERKSPDWRETSMTVPFVNPLVLRRELENVLSSNELALAARDFIDTHPILFWNLVFYFQRLSVPSHLTQWIGQLDFWTDGSKSLAGTVLPDAQVLVRCVYDYPKLHDDECNRPLYLMALDSDALVDQQSTVADSSLVAALLLEQRSFNKAVVAQVVESLLMSNLHKPIQLLINEHRKRTAVVPGVSPSKQGGLPRHCSMYRDILFLALVWFGRDVRRDDLDREYLAAFQKLPPRIAALLPPADHPPKVTARLCRKIFMPLDVF